MERSFSEKSVWAQIVGLLVGLGVYGVMSTQIWMRGERDLSVYVVPFMVALVLQVVVMIIGHAASALRGAPEPEDERDRWIDVRASSRASWVLGAGVFAAIMALVWEVDSFWVAHLLLVALYASEILGLGLRALAYRRGA